MYQIVEGFINLNVKCKDEENRIFNTFVLFNWSDVHDQYNKRKDAPRSSQLFKKWHKKVEARNTNNSQRKSKY